MAIAVSENGHSTITIPIPTSVFAARTAISSHDGRGPFRRQRTGFLKVLHGGQQVVHRGASIGVEGSGGALTTTAPATIGILDGLPDGLLDFQSICRAGISVFEILL